MRDMRVKLFIEWTCVGPKVWLLECFVVPTYHQSTDPLLYQVEMKMSILEEFSSAGREVRTIGNEHVVQYLPHQIW